MNDMLIRPNVFPDSALLWYTRAAEVMQLFLHNRRKKIKMLHALRGGESGRINAHYLNERPVELMPNLFSFIQDAGKCSGTEEENLDIMFQVIRSKPAVVPS